ncbi:MAG: RsfS/YbeB/iojap family protein, partial [Telluria sp.]
LVDLGDMIVHIMQPAIRQYYRLEEIWGEKPVKLGAAKRKSTPEAIDAAEPKVKSKHLAANQDAPEVKPVNERKPAARKAAAKTAATKAPAKKPAAKPASKAVGKVVRVAPSKTEIAAVEATKAKPPKRTPKVAAAVDAEPVKKVIKRVARKAAE